MLTHKTDIELWATERERELPGRKPTLVRWKCACGRLGPALPITSTSTGASRAERRARNGGLRHTAAMERSR